MDSSIHVTPKAIACLTPRTVETFAQGLGIQLTPLEAEPGPAKRLTVPEIIARIVAHLALNGIRGKIIDDSKGRDIQFNPTVVEMYSDTPVAKKFRFRTGGTDDDWQTFAGRQKSVEDFFEVLNGNVERLVARIPFSDLTVVYVDGAAEWVNKIPTLQILNGLHTFTTYGNKFEDLKQCRADFDRRLALGFNLPAYFLSHPFKVARAAGYELLPTINQLVRDFIPNLDANLSTRFYACPNDSNFGIPPLPPLEYCGKESDENVWNLAEPHYCGFCMIPLWGRYYINPMADPFKTEKKEEKKKEKKEKKEKEEKKENGVVAVPAAAAVPAVPAALPAADNDGEKKEEEEEEEPIILLYCAHCGERVKNTQVLLAVDSGRTQWDVLAYLRELLERKITHCFTNFDGQYLDTMEAILDGVEEIHPEQYQPQPEQQRFRFYQLGGDRPRFIGVEGKTSDLLTARFEFELPIVRFAYVDI